MAASAGTLIMVGASGRTYNVDVYIPDAVATSWTFSTTGLAGTGSPTTFRAPEAVRVVDFVLATAPTAVGCSLQVNGVPIPGGTLRYTGLLTTTVTRTPVNIPVRAGDFIAGLQF